MNKDKLCNYLFRKQKRSAYFFVSSPQDDEYEHELNKATVLAVLVGPKHYKMVRTKSSKNGE